MSSVLIKQLRCAQPCSRRWGDSLGRTLTLVLKLVLQYRVADMTMSMFQEQQCILEELLLNPSESPVSMATAASSKKPVTPQLGSYGEKCYAQNVKSCQISMGGQFSRHHEERRASLCDVG